MIVSMEKNEREVWVGKNRFYFSEDNILYITAVGELDDELATKWVEESKKLLEPHVLKLQEGKVRVLIDLNNAGKPSAKAVSYQKFGLSAD